MEYIPYSCQNVQQDDIDAVSAVLHSEYLTQGPAIPEFERVFAVRHGVAHAVAVSSATAGLHIGALALGLKSGSRLWTTPISFVASANCGIYCGGAVDFVDIDPVSRNMSVPALRRKLERAEEVGELPDIVVPVDFAGFSADMQEIEELARRFGFRVMEDASHATGASYRGRPVGHQFSDLSVFSFHAVKIVTTGEGGIVTTNDDALAATLRKLRSHGISRDPYEFEQPPDGPWYYEQQILGFNYRITDIQASLWLSQLRRLDEFSQQRTRRAERYYELLGDLPLFLPSRQSDRISAWHLFVIEIDGSRTHVSRAEVFIALRDAKIGVNVHYIPIHLQPYYRNQGYKPGDYPAAEAYYSRAISIPLYPALTDAQQDRVSSVLHEVLRS